MSNTQPTDDIQVITWRQNSFGTLGIQQGLKGICNLLVRLSSKAVKASLAEV